MNSIWVTWAQQWAMLLVPKSKNGVLLAPKSKNGQKPPGPKSKKTFGCGRLNALTPVSVFFSVCPHPRSKSRLEPCSEPSQAKPNF